MATVSGAVLALDATPLANATVTFNSLVQQILSGIAVQPIITSRRTDSNGILQPVALPWGLTVIVKVSWNGVTYPPTQAIVPEMDSLTLSQLFQGGSGN